MENFGKRECIHQPPKPARSWSDLPLSIPSADVLGTTHIIKAGKDCGHKIYDGSIDSICSFDLVPDLTLNGLTHEDPPELNQHPIGILVVPYLKISDS